jgi:hypothetical protein
MRDYMNSLIEYHERKYGPVEQIEPHHKQTRARIMSILISNLVTNDVIHNTHDKQDLIRQVLEYKN